MKKGSLIFNIVLAIAVIALFILHFTDRNDACSNTPADDAAANSTEKVSIPEGSIVYIQLDSLVSQYDMFNDLRTELEAKAEIIRTDLEKKGISFQRDTKDFENKVKKGLVTSSQAEKMQQDLLNRQAELQNYSMQKQQEIAEEETVMYNRVMDAIKTYVDNYNKEKQYSLILTTTVTTNSVISGDQGRNITGEILDGLNQEYIRNRNK